MAVEQVVIEPAPGAQRDFDGRLAVLRRRYDRGEIRAVSRLTIDREGRIIAVIQPMFGSNLTIRATDQEDATRPHPPYSMLRSVMVRSPFRIGTPAVQGHIRYRFSFRDGIVFALPQTSEQRVSVSGDGVTVDICPDCGPGLTDDRSTLAEALGLLSGCRAIIQDAHDRRRSRVRRYRMPGGCRSWRAASRSGCRGSTSPAISRRSTPSREARATAQKQRCCSRRSGGPPASRPGSPAAWSITRALSRRQQRVHAAQLGDRLDRRRMAKLRCRARKFRRHPYRADHRRRRRPQIGCRHPARPGCCNGKRWTEVRPRPAG